MKLTFVGTPTDIGASVAGCRLGPGALRVAGVGKTLRVFGVGVRDADDVAGPSNPQSLPVDSYHHLPEVIEWNRTVRGAVAAKLADGRISVLVGGDHSLVIGSISTIAAYCRKTGKKLHIVWVDAYANINTNELTPSGNIHGMPIACLLGSGPEELTGMSSWKPAIEVDDIHQARLCSIDPDEKRALIDKGLEVLDMRSLDEAGMRHAVERALHDIDGNIHIRLSLSLDFVDPQAVLSIGTPIVEGPTYQETQLATEMIADTGGLGFIDLVGINPTLDTRNITAELAVDLVESLFGKSTLLRFTET